MPLYFGKYRAYVVDIADVEQRGRIRVRCPKVLGDYTSNWCEPCFPYAYEKGGDFYLPKLNDTVWVEFEAGDSNLPIWVGSWHSMASTSLATYAKAQQQRIFEHDGCRIEMERNRVLMTNGTCQIILDGGVLTIRNGSGAQIIETGANVNIN